MTTATTATAPAQTNQSPAPTGIKLRVQRTGIKFLPQSQGTNMANPRERRGEEREYLLGVFEGMGEDGTQDAKKLVRVWFSVHTEHKMAWKLWTEKRQGVLVIGDLSEKETDYDNKTIGMSNAYIARYDSNGEFKYNEPVPNAQGGEDLVVRTIKGAPNGYVTLDIDTQVTLRTAPALTKDGGPQKSTLSLKEKHRLRDEQAAANLHKAAVNLAETTEAIKAGILA